MNRPNHAPTAIYADGRTNPAYCSHKHRVVVLAPRIWRDADGAVVRFTSKTRCRDCSTTFFMEWDRDD